MLNVVGWIAVLIVPAMLYTLFWFGMGVGEGHCDAVRILELEGMLTPVERHKADNFFECGVIE